MTLLLLVAATYIATNIDNLLLLVAWLLAQRGSPWRIAVGFSLAAIAVLAASWALALSASVIPVEYVGYLGVVPMLLGLKLLFDLIRDRSSDSTGLAGPTVSSATIAVTLFANSVDTMLVFAPLLADSSDTADFRIITAYLFVAAAWFVLAQVFSRHARRLQSIVTIGQWIAPLVMIVVGFYILNNTATDVLAGS
ncbi:MAG: cadmium resistance transporter [Woeseiaceae bacterium]